MPVEKLKWFLDKENVKYTTISHSRAYTAQEVAQSAHIPGKELAKTVMVKIDGKMAMAVLHASYKVDFDLLKTSANAREVEERIADARPQAPADRSGRPPESARQRGTRADEREHGPDLAPTVNAPPPPEV